MTLPAPVGAKEVLVDFSFYNPDVALWRTKGINYYLNGMYEEAQDCFINACRLAPNEAEHHMRIGLTLFQRGQFADAHTFYNRALELDPNHADTLCNLGFLTMELGYRENAQRLFERALELNPRNQMAMANLSVAYLQNLQFRKGWELLGARFTTIPATAVMREYSWMKVWDGAPTKKLAIWPEQGIGDQIIFSSVLHELEKRGQPFVLEVALRLVPIFKRSFPNVQVVSTPESPAAFYTCTAHVPVMTLAAMLRPDIESFDGRQPYIYLLADQERRAQMGEYLTKSKKKIAISWRSRQPMRPRMEAKKSGDLAMFKALAQRDDVELVSAQYGDGGAENDFRVDVPVTRIPGLDTFNDIDGVLALIDACDMVVTTCNVTAHYACALGKKTFVLYPSDQPPCWYWQHVEGKSLWYPTAEIVSRAAKWEELIAAVNERI